MKFKNYILAGILVGIAWLLPETWLSVFFAFAGSIYLCLALSKRASYLGAIFFGVTAHAIGFHWLIDTISDFGGYTLIPSLSIFFLFLIFSSIPICFSIFFLKYLPKSLNVYSLLIPIAWVSAEVLPLKIFPWEMGHALLKATSLIQISDLFGSLTVSFLLLFVSSGIANYLINKKINKSLIGPLIVLGLSILYGYKQQLKFIPPQKLPLTVALVQANISIQEKNNIKYFKSNADKYINLSNNLMPIEENLLVIWPESVLTHWTNPEIRNVDSDLNLPRPATNKAFLIGALSAKSREKLYNSAYAILEDGTIPYPYHKQILMPFGEYMPLASIFPSIKNLNPTAGDFTAGKNLQVFDFTFNNGTSAKVSPLICYEDIVPKMARNVTKLGAQILVNLTNDAWFGNTIAPFQHNQIAAFRAVENKRYLLRSTNSGVTTVINPTGQTVSFLKPFTEGILKESINTISEQTYYTRYFGRKIWWFLLLICIYYSYLGIIRKNSDI